MSSRDRQSLVRRTALVAGLAGASLLTGCYERVVEAEGPGTGGVTVYEANVNDDGLFGTRSKKDDSNIISGEPTIRPK